MQRTLTVRRERLTELAYDDLASIVAAGELTPVIQTWPLNQCLALTATSCECCTNSQSC